MEYVKKLRESGESYAVIRIADEELENYLTQGYEKATKEEYEADGGEIISE